MRVTGDQIRAARERAQMTQQEVAGLVGVSLRTVGNWERGASVPRSRMAAVIEVLTIDLDDDLVTGKFPEGGIQYLILAHKPRNVSYADISRACGGIPSTNRVQSLATEDTDRFPRPDTITGLSRGLGVSVRTILHACAVSLRLPVEPEPKDAVTLYGTDVLPDSAREALRSIARELIAAYAAQETIEDQDDHDLAAYKTGKESMGSRLRREQDEAAEASEASDE